MNDRMMKYNPAFLSEDALIRGFVARHFELEQLLEIIRDNTGASNQHVLVIGPRGRGKTTLVLRAAAEVRRDASLAEEWFPIVFGEESYRVTSPGEFWLEALFHLSERLDDPRWKRTYLDLRDEPDEDRLRRRALAQLMDFADERGTRLLLVVENLNMLFGAQVSGDDAWSLRHTLMNESRLMLLGTATSRFREIEEYNEALYELFKLVDLDPLDEAEVRALWTSVAGTAPSPEEIRPIEILTGGNPRLIRIISEFAAETSFFELMTNLTQLVDEHTEYFKHHLDDLPPQERKVFVSLADLWDPSPSRTVAGAARLDVSKTSALLSRLVDRGAVAVARTDGRTKYYQVAERMYNIYHLMRRRGKMSSRVRAVVRFMIHLYRGDDLVRTTASILEEAYTLTAEQRRDHFHAYEAVLDLTAEAPLKRRILEVTAPLFRSPDDIPSSVRPFIAALSGDDPNLTRSTSDGDSSHPDAEAERLRTLQVDDVEDAETLVLMARALTRSSQLQTAANALNKAVRVDAKRLDAWMGLGFTAWMLGRHEEALDAFDRAIELAPDDAHVWNGKGIALYGLGRYKQALDAFDRALELEPDDANAWNGKGATLDSLGRYEEALDASNHALELEPDNLTAWHLKGIMLRTLSRYEEALDAYDRTIALASDNPSSWNGKGTTLASLGRYEEALDAFDRALKLAPDDANAWHIKGITLGRLGRHREAFAVYEHIVNLGDYPIHVLNAIAWNAFLTGDAAYYARGEQYARQAIDQAPEKGAYRHTLASLLGAGDRWAEAMEQAALFVQDVPMVEAALSEVIDFFVEAAAAGYAENARRVIRDSPAAEPLEPLLVALRLLEGDQVDVALEIEEVARDVVARIEARRAERTDEAS